MCISAAPWRHLNSALDIVEWSSSYMTFNPQVMSPGAHWIVGTRDIQCLLNCFVLCNFRKGLLTTPSM